MRCSFSNAAPGDDRNWFSGYGRTTRLSTRLLVNKKSDRLRIFGGLPDAEQGNRQCDGRRDDGDGQFNAMV